MFVSLGSIIGSGWLLGALTAAKLAGPASLLSWVLAAIMLTLLALVHAELGAAYPVAGGTARFPAFAFGPLAGFAAGWMAWLQAVSLAPIEVEATLSYSDHIGWVHRNFPLLRTDGTLTGTGLIVASVFMLLFFRDQRHRGQAPVGVQLDHRDLEDGDPATHDRRPAAADVPRRQLLGRRRVRAVRRARRVRRAARRRGLRPPRLRAGDPARR
jgi:hypothetical protein